MKFSTFVMLGSIFVLTILIVCVSVHAYNAYGSKSLNHTEQEVTMYASVNGWGLRDGEYSMSAKVGSNEVRLDNITYANGNILSRTISRTGSWDNSGEAHAYINGWDHTYEPIKKVSTSGSASYDPDTDQPQ